MLLGLLPGEVFVHRNIGNIISPVDGSWPAALRYAVDELKVRSSLLIHNEYLSNSIDRGLTVLASRLLI
jgi:carbonic anhydrase